MVEQTYRYLSALIAPHDQIALFLTLIAILIVGGWVVAQLTAAPRRSYLHGTSSQFETDDMNETHSGSPDSVRINRSRNASRLKNKTGAFEGRHMGRSTFSEIDVDRQLVLDPFQGDVYGRVGEQILGLMKSGFKGHRALEIFTGFNAHERVAEREREKVLHASKVRDAGSGKSSKPPYTVTIEGEVTGCGVQLKFFPQGPLYLNETVADGDTERSDLYGHSGKGFVAKGGHANDKRRVHALSYECCDFPLFELKGLTTGFQGEQRTLLLAVMAGLMSRGCGISGQFVNARQLLKWGKSLDQSLDGIRLTQKELHAEMLVVAAWCYFVAGVLKLNEAPLKRALALFRQIDDEFWHQRELTEWAGIKSNESMAAITLALIEEDKPGGEPSAYYRHVQKTAYQAMRSFRRDNFPHNWGKLMCKLALAYGSLEGTHDEGSVAEGFLTGQGAGRTHAGPDISGRVIADGVIQERALDGGAVIPKDYRAIEEGLDQAIEYWRTQGQDDAICEAYYAKGKLAQNTAKRHMGVQDWERAENALLAALALSTEDMFGVVHRRPVIRFELGQLYLGWGTRFGEAELLEKAIHQFTVLLDRHSLVSHNIYAEAERALGQCYLNFGGITNRTEHLKRAIGEYRYLLSKRTTDIRRVELERALCVANARLALKQRNRAAIKRAITCVSAVIGQKNQLWPSRDVLLRLRARLRELLFTLEGDDVALDRAIKDRRELMAAASEGLKDLRWAVEVGDFVGLLSRRQYKFDGQMHDFNEAHYLLEKAIAICENNSADQEVRHQKLDIPHIKASLHLKLAKLLATFARVQFDEPALRESVGSFEQFLELTPRGVNPLDRAHALNDVGQIMMDLSEHYGHHEGLHRAVKCFAEAHDIYLEAEYIDLSNRMRRFLENAQAAILAYDVPFVEPPHSDVPIKLSLHRL